jgi:hypothetical protein
MRLAGKVECLGEIKAYNMLVGELEGKRLIRKNTQMGG